MYRVCRDEKASSDAEKSIYTCPILLSLLLFSHMHTRAYACTYSYIYTHTHTYIFSLSLSLFPYSFQNIPGVSSSDMTTSPMRWNTWSSDPRHRVPFTRSGFYWTMFSICCAGAVVSPECLGKLFDPFYNLWVTVRVWEKPGEGVLKRRWYAWDRCKRSGEKPWNGEKSKHERNKSSKLHCSSTVIFDLRDIIS